MASSSSRPLQLLRHYVSSWLRQLGALYSRLHVVFAAGVSSCHGEAGHHGAARPRRFDDKLARPRSPLSLLLDLLRYVSSRMGLGGAFYLPSSSTGVRRTLQPNGGPEPEVVSAAASPQEDLDQHVDGGEVAMASSSVTEETQLLAWRPGVPPPPGRPGLPRPPPVGPIHNAVPLLAERRREPKGRPKNPKEGRGGHNHNAAPPSTHETK